MKHLKAKLSLVCLLASCFLLIAGFAAAEEEEREAAAPAAEESREAKDTESESSSPSATPALLGGSCDQASALGGQDPLAASPCLDCDSNENYCTSGAQCNSFCQALVGENGFCMPSCGCCVCPEERPGGGDPEPFPNNCIPVCDCNGTLGTYPQGCPNGCSQLNCN